MVGSVDHQHTGEVNFITFTAVATDSNAQNAQTVEAWTLFIAATSPHLSPDERGDVLEDLGIPDGFVDDGHEAEVAVDDTRYSFRTMPGGMWMLSVGHADS